LAQTKAARHFAGEGRPFDGYFAVGILAGAALFAVGKTARR
jgi:hypothetical protein